LVPAKRADAEHSRRVNRNKAAPARARTSTPAPSSAAPRRGHCRRRGVRSGAARSAYIAFHALVKYKLGVSRGANE
jgi:hypothetical protein